MTEDIETFLGTVSEATAKTIAAGIGLPHGRREGDQQDVRGRQGRTRKRAGGGSEYVYWLARGAAPVPPADAAPPPAAAPSLAEAIASLPPSAVAADTTRVIAELRAEVERLTAERDAAQLKADTWRANAATLEARIDGSRSARSAPARPVRHRRPQLQAAAPRIAREGPAPRPRARAQRKESEVLVLEPVGRIVRGTEWMPR